MSQADAMRRALLQRLGHHGWQRTSVRPFHSRRTPDEVWELESTWSPQGTRAYLLFRSDCFDRPLGQIGIFREPPETLYLYHWNGWLVRRRWRADLPIFFAELARIRDESQPETSSPPALAGPESRLQLLRDRLCERRVRLYTCACLRRFPHIVEQERNRYAIETAEQYADGLLRKREMKKARKAACIPWLTSFDAYEEAVSTLEAATRLLTPPQQMILDDLLTDVIGCDRATVRFSWLRRNDGIVVKIAQTIYQEHAFAQLPILADALEEAGCDNADILNHCRQPGEHMRGCWLLDLILGKK